MKLSLTHRNGCLFPILACFFLGGLPVVNAGVGGSSRRYWTGLWEGVDSGDGAQIQRSIVPVLNDEDENTYYFTGRSTYFRMCATADSPAAPGVLNGVGMVDDDGLILTVLASLTCLGEAEPRAVNRTAVYEAYTSDIIVENFGPATEYLHRMT